MMGKFKKYEKYQSTEISWLGDIPKHWQIKKAKYLFRIRKRIVGELGFNVLSITQKGIKIKDIKSGGGQLAMDYSKYQLAEKGDFAMNHMDLLTGYVDISKYHGVVSPDYRVFSLEDKNSFDKYYLYLFQMGYRSKIFFAYGQGSSQLGRWRLPAKAFNNFFFPCPNLSEQKAIVNFLDKRVDQIDHYIQQKEKTIALLQERKAAIINQAVTKGLDPTVEMKDSGIEWLGEIPKHWEVKRLRYVGQCQNGISESGDFFGHGYPFVSYGDVYKNIELPLEVSGLANSSTSNRKHFSVLEGDIFFTRTSETMEEIGLTSTCMKTIENATFAGFLIRFRPKEKYLVKGFSKYYFRSLLHRAFFVKEMNLVIRASLSQELLKRLPVILPNLKQQQKIADFLDEKTTKIDLVINNAKKEITLIKEYRESLISAAVTGKIDVRS